MSTGRAGGRVYRFKSNRVIFATNGAGGQMDLLSFSTPLIHKITMPIRVENRWLYPIDWPQLSAAIRFGRAGRRCERCARPHLVRVAHLGDGRWWDGYRWRCAEGRRTGVAAVALADVRTTYVVLACAHLDHDPSNNAPTNLAALCQRCHMLHDAAEHRWQRWWNAFRRRAVHDLYEDPQAVRRRLRSDGSWRPRSKAMRIAATVDVH